MNAIPIYLGYDPRESAAFTVCAQSIIENASAPVAIIPLALHLLRDYEEQHTDGTNQFIYSRFLVPHLERYGWHNTHAIYLDGDMLVRGDIIELWNLRRHDVGVQVVKHEYKTTAAKKYLGTELEAPNENYPCKNWSSVMIWNCRFMENRKLTPDFVQKQTGKFLHRFEWLSPNRVGTIPIEWNWLVGEYPTNDDAKLLHHTLGSPALGGQYAHVEGATEWRQTMQRALAPLMGPGGTEG